MALNEAKTHILCDAESCPAKIANHKWAVIKADGWFFGKKNHEAWCPKHTPDWVHKWQKRNEASKVNQSHNMS